MKDFENLEKTRPDLFEVPGAQRLEPLVPPKRQRQNLSIDFRFTNNHFTETWSGSEEGSYVRLVNFSARNSRLEGDKEEEEC